jgi:hypothetical protein
MAHYRYCVYTMHVFRISCPIFSEALLAVHECSQPTCKFHENQHFRPEGIYVEVIIILLFVLSHVLYTPRSDVRVEWWREGRVVDFRLVRRWVGEMGWGSTWKVAALKTEKPL